MTKPTEGPYTYQMADKRIVGPVRNHKLSHRPVGDGSRYPEMTYRDVIAHVSCPNAEAQDANGRLLAKSWEMREWLEAIPDIVAHAVEATTNLPTAEAAAREADSAQAEIRALLASIDGDSQ